MRVRSRLGVGVGVVAGSLGRAHGVLGRARRVARLARLHHTGAAARLALAAAPGLQRLTHTGHHVTTAYLSLTVVMKQVDFCVK